MHYYISGTVSTGIYLLCDMQDVYDLDSSYFRAYLPPLPLWPSGYSVNLRKQFILYRMLPPLPEFCPMLLSPQKRPYSSATCAEAQVQNAVCVAFDTCACPCISRRSTVYAQNHAWETISQLPFEPLFFFFKSTVYNQRAMTYRKTSESSKVSDSRSLPAFL